MKPSAEVAILRGLIAMRQSGRFQAVYCDSDVVRVVWSTGISRRLTWSQAGRLVLGRRARRDGLAQRRRRAEYLIEVGRLGP